MINIENADIDKSKTCIIYSKASEIPYDNWTSIKKDNLKLKSVYDFQFNQHVNVDKTISKSIFKSGIGIFIKYEKEIFVVSCYHIIQNSNEIYGYVNDNTTIKKINFQISGFIKEVDLVVLKPVENIDKYNIDCIDINHSENINLSLENAELQQIKLLYHDYDRNITNYIIDTIELYIEHTYLKSILIPKIPLFRFTISQENIKNLDGISGSPIMLNNNIIGMTICSSNTALTDSTLLEAMPKYFINIFAKMILNENKYKQHELIGGNIKTQIVDINNKYVNYVGHDIINEITYKKTNNKNFKFKSGYIIIKINNKLFTEEGKIHLEEINYDVLLETYLMILGTYKNQHISIEYIDNTIPIYNPIKTIIIQELKNYNEYFNVNINNNNNYIYWNGLTFCELSEELIISLFHNNINLVGKEFNNYKTYNKTINKYVVLIDIDYNIVQRENIKDFADMRLPYISYDSGYKLLILNKINNTNIKDLNDLKLKLLAFNNTKLTFKYIINDTVCKMCFDK